VRRSALALTGAIGLALLAAGAAPRTATRAAQPPSLGGCQMFPADNIWNTPIDTLPLDANSAAYVNAIGSQSHVHADFGSGIWPTTTGFPIGIPYTTVPGNQAAVPVSFQYASESDPGPYPIPANAPIEGDPNSGDRHVLVVDTGHCKLYEMFDSVAVNGGTSWTAGSGAVFDLGSNALRPSTWTSADAAGLPILPGLVRRDEVVAGAINHAIRFTAPQTANRFVWPARHQAGSSGSGLPPMGERFRLKASFDISTYPADDRVILTALQKYGMILADNGSSWYLSGAPDPAWDNNVLHLLGNIQGSSFEAVDESSLMVDPNSAQVKAAALGTPVLVAPVEGATNVPLTPTVSWNAAPGSSSGTTQYTAYIWDPTVSAMVFQQTTTGLSATVPAGSALQLGRFYYYTVQACNGTSCAALARWEGFTTVAGIGTPALTAPAEGAIGVSLTPALQWSQPPGAVSGVTQYTAYVWDPAANAMRFQQTTAGLSANVPASAGLAAGHFYYWSVIVCNGASCGPLARWIGFTTAGTPGAPGLLAPAEGATHVGTTPTLRWSAPAGAVTGTTQYTAMVWDPAANTMKFQQTTAALTTAVPASAGLVAGHFYYWTVQACNGASCGPLARWIGVTP